jgi:glycosyltransferase involved in cell wall biosynthesis
MKASVGKRILMLLENNPYPLDVRVRRECRALAKAGYQVSVICPGERGQQRKETVDDVSVYRYPAPPESLGPLNYLCEYTYSLAASFLLSLYVLLREGFDIIHAANPPDTLFLIAAFYKLFGKRFVFDHHDLSPELYDVRFAKRIPLIHSILVMLEKGSCRLADLVIATNQSYKLVEMQRGRVPEERIVIVRNAPERNLFRQIPAEQISGDKPHTVIAYAGMMGQQDGLDYLLRSLQYLAYDLKRKDFSCILIGGRGEARKYLADLTIKLHLEQFVTFTGWVSDEDYVRHLLAADICVDPDPSNPFNDRCSMNKMVEYMAAGKPIVAFDLPEHRFTAQDAAVYVRDNDEMQYARELAALMDAPERRKQMGAQGRSRFETDLAWERSVEHLLAGYRALQVRFNCAEERSSRALSTSGPESIDTPR